jgi:hypothetical protein
VTFGLGTEATTSVEIQWPSGIHQKINNVKADQRLNIPEQ